MPEQKPVKWVCSVCGYEHEGAEPPDECPVCKAPASAFKKLESSGETTWHRVAGVDELDEGRVKTAAVGNQTFALTRFEGEFAVLDNKCPHQGGPLGEGSIENGLLRCPWHGWDFHPTTGKSPGSFDDGVKTHPVDVRDDGVYVGIDAQPAPVTTVSDIMVETMINWGVTHVFGMVGHSNLGLADAMRRQAEAGKLHYYGIRHEGAAAFAASGYAKLTGKPAACLAIAGPGATNLLTGLWDARMDRMPVLALTGQVDVQVLGRGAFQEVDLASAFKPVSLFSQPVLSSSRHAELMNLAIKNALLGRDVAHLIFPDAVQTQPVPESTEPSGPAGRMPSQSIAPPAEALDAAVALLSKHRRPVIIAGHGARFHMEPVIALAEKLNCPILTTFKGKGLIPDSHPLAAGVLGRSGTMVASHLMNTSDMLVVFGASFSNHTGITHKRPTIQVDFDPLALGRVHPITVPVLGEIAVTARLLHERLGGGTWVDQRDEIAERWKIWRAEKQRRAQDDRGDGINSAAIFAALGHVAPKDAVLAVDVGNNTYSFGRYFETKAGQAVLMSGYLGSIGFGFPAAMGAWAAEPERTIVAITGDGGFGQYLAELTTAVKYDMNITHVLLHNGELGKITKEQRAGQFPVWQTSLHNPDFSKYAELCGALGIRVTQPSELDEALERALAHKGPALVEVMCDAELI